MMKKSLLPLLVACSTPDPVAPSAPAPKPSGAPPTASAPPVATVDPVFAAKIREASAKYVEWTRVDEKPNIAPFLCRMPTGDDYGKASHIRMSDAEDSPHDKKLYFLYASAKDAYLALSHETFTIGQHDLQVGTGRSRPPLPDGFTIVKESFHAVPARARPPRANEVGARELVNDGKAPEPVTWVETGNGQRLEAGAPSGLYVMTKLGNKTPGTDAGWIYGTIATNGTVTSAGRVASCMSCHVEAGDHRLFGVQPTKQLAPSAAPPGREGW